MSLAAYVAILGRGPGRSRSLTQSEAGAAMACILSGDAAPEAIGALLMLLRMKGESPDEIAGFALAARAALPDLPAVALDWPSYAAGRTRGRPWFLLSARLVAKAGFPVLLHGRNGSDGAVRAHLEAAGIPLVRSCADLPAQLSETGVAYSPLEQLHPGLSQLLDLRQLLGLRSCINTVCRMLNPANAAASVQGVFHPSYRLLQADAAKIMGWSALTVIKGGGGEFERHPGKPLERFGLRAGSAFGDVLAAIEPGDARRLSDVPAAIDLAGLWSGQQDDPFATAIVIGTAALALETLGVRQPLNSANQLWASRHDALAA